MSSRDDADAMSMGFRSSEDVHEWQRTQQQRPAMTSTDTQGISACDQAFEEKYKTSSRDPSNAGDLAKFRDGWNAAQQELPRSYGGSTFDTRPFGAGATVRLHFSDSEEAEKWWVSITGRLKERK